jgi:hypothetical protein
MMRESRSHQVHIGVVARVVNNQPRKLRKLKSGKNFSAQTVPDRSSFSSCWKLLNPFYWIKRLAIYDSAAAIPSGRGSGKAASSSPTLQIERGCH